MDALMVTTVEMLGFEPDNTMIGLSALGLDNVTVNRMNGLTVW